MEILQKIGIFTLIFIGVIVTCYIIYRIRKLEKYPFCHITEDISGRRNVTINQLIEECLLNENNRKSIMVQKEVALNWKNRMYKKHPTQKQAINQIFNLNNENDIIFEGTRNQTRYTQTNYIRSPYQVQNTVISKTLSLKECIDIIDKLQKLNFEMTLEQATTKDQRKLMKPELKQTVKDRDNYTCQLCGKYMPDEIGLHVSHIIPISRGGKSNLSNLQVLCSKCNVNKSNKG